MPLLTLTELGESFFGRFYNDAAPAALLKVRRALVRFSVSGAWQNSSLSSFPWCGKSDAVWLSRKADESGNGREPEMLRVCCHLVAENVAT